MRISTNYTNHTNENRNSFTLIELLVVLALVAILSVVVVMTLNPAELIKQARDSNRLSDLSTINTALNLFSADVTSGFMGTSTVVYISIPSVSPTCVGLGLPALPSGYTYNCVAIANLRNTDGTGWIPVNFQRISSNSPISQLPIDPINTTTTRLYYSYVSGGSWELNAAIEAAKNKPGGSNDLVSKDGGNAISTYEIGNNLILNPIETGDSSLVGYWNFEEGPNTTSTDRSGYGNHGTWYGTSTAQEHYAAGKVGQYAGSFNGNSDYIYSPTVTTNTSNMSISLWVKQSVASIVPVALYYNGNSGSNGWGIFVSCSGPNNRIDILVGGRTCTAVNSTYVLPLQQWINLAAVNQSGNWKIYANTVLVASSQGALLPNVPSGVVGGIGFSNTTKLLGLVDEVRVYSRALSDAEVSALYDAGK